MKIQPSDYMKKCLRIRFDAQVASLLDTYACIVTFEKGTHEQLLHILMEADKKTLQIVVLKMMGYAPKEISTCIGMPEQTIYTKLRRLREKIKKVVKAE